MIGTAAALITMAIVNGGAQVASAKIQSNAAKNAVRAQQAGTDQAMQYAQNAYQQQQQLMSPYLAAGYQANNMMGRLIGPPGGARYASSGPPMAALPTTYGAQPGNQPTFVPTPRTTMAAPSVPFTQYGAR